MHERKRDGVGWREYEQREREQEGEADVPLSREPDKGLDPKILGPRPKDEADA